jgi:hypothetical protein
LRTATRRKPTRNDPAGKTDCKRTGELPTPTLKDDLPHLLDWQQYGHVVISQQ